MSWRDGLTDKECFESYIKSLDMRERIDCDIDQVILEEFNEEQYNYRVIANWKPLPLAIIYARPKSVFDA